MDERNQPSILLVDDEENVRRTLGPLLERHGFTVVLAATVAEALAQITQRAFDVLIADLNVGSAGDGFTVVSAMRRTQPDAVTLILTGYPAFESAWKAIQEQVDDYLVKPTNISELVEKIKTKLSSRRKPARRLETKRLSIVLLENRDSIIQSWLQAAKADAEIGTISVSDSERVDHLPGVLEAATNLASGEALTAEDMRTAALHGTTRRKQGYTVPLLIREERLFAQAMADCIQTNLLRITIDYLMPDFAAMLAAMDTLLEQSARAFLEAPARKTNKTSPRRKK